MANVDHVSQESNENNIKNVLSQENTVGEVMDVQPPKDDVPSQKDDVQPPNDDVQPPNDDVQPPNGDVQPPIDDVQSPNDDVQPLNDDVQPLNDDVQPPIDDVQPPNDDVQPPNDDVQPPNDAEDVAADEIGSDKAVAADEIGSDKAVAADEIGSDKVEVEYQEHDQNEQSSQASQDKDDEENKHKSAELAMYWSVVEDNPMDFTGWTYLLQYVEQENDPEDCRKCYDAFFAHYPYCYGYWKKYSDVEKKHGNMERAKEVFEKGLRAIPLSVELWLHYLSFYIAEFGSEPNAKDNIRKLYERALAAAGLEFRSDKLWDSFISWESADGNLRGVTAIYERLIQTPTQLYSHHWDNFKSHINNHHPKEILDIDTFLKFRSEIVGKSLNYQFDDDQDVGLDEALQAESTDLDAPPGMLTTLGDEKEVKIIRDKLIESRERLFKANEAEVSKRWTFEESIRRPYFHVKPLERGQLKNWRDYLDFEISQGNHDRIVILFERCMIACALYEDFWMKYAKYLELQHIDVVRSVYQRACDIHLPKKPYIHLAWAAFEERRGNYTLARTILTNIEKNVPGLAMVCMRRISLERRNKNYQAAEELFKTYIDSAVNHKMRTFFSIKCARFLQKVMGEMEKAKKVLLDLLDADHSNEKVFLQLLDLEYQCQPIDEDRVMDVFSRSLNSDVSLEFKVMVSQRRMEFLEDFGTCIQKITEAYDDHQKLLKEAGTRKKRPDKEHLPEEPTNKKFRLEPVPSAPAVPEYNVALSMPQTGPPPPPDTSYGYTPWSNAGYPAAVPNAYPDYPYPVYPMQYNYYGYNG